MPKHSARAVALQDFLDREGPELRRVAFLMTGSWTAADDALSTAATRLVRERADLEDLPQLTRTARRHLLHHLATKEGSAHLVDEVRPGRHAADPGLHLMSALATLPFTQRAAVVLRRFCHLAPDRIAEALEVPPEEVAGLLTSGIDGLRETLTDMGDQLVTDDPAGSARYRRPAETTHEEFDG
ncbi:MULTISPECIES: RNA polymerase sigma factor [unclassified Luteococcus]|uniref:RNA polymerase sigma factor n=1 Tax=unclassified Luteococcus TaxID=2639923 RepID=UPI00313B9D4F